MGIDFDRIHRIETEYGLLEPLEAYYRKRRLSYETSSPLVPQTRSLLRQALRRARSVLDIGCGDGQTLLACADLFTKGTGLDEDEYVICQAIAQARQQGVSNVEFVLGKAIGLPFPDATFDLIFSERGPMGHADCTLVEALRVLQPGGRIFIETGAWTGEGRTLLTNLEEERDRFERLGIRTELLATRIEQHRFKDLYAWFEMQCSIWRYFENTPPFPYTKESLSKVAAKAGGANGPVDNDYQTIWMGGQKSGLVSDASK